MLQSTIFTCSTSKMSDFNRFFISLNVRKSVIKVSFCNNERKFRIQNKLEYNSSPKKFIYTKKLNDVDHKKSIRHNSDLGYRVRGFGSGKHLMHDLYIVHHDLHVSLDLDYIRWGQRCRRRLCELCVCV